jgi:hypothetical protein
MNCMSRMVPMSAVVRVPTRGDIDGAVAEPRDVPRSRTILSRFAWSPPTPLVRRIASHASNQHHDRHDTACD